MSSAWVFSASSGLICSRNTFSSTTLLTQQTAADFSDLAQGCKTYDKTRFRLSSCPLFSISPTPAPFYYIYMKKSACWQTFLTG